MRTLPAGDRADDAAKRSDQRCRAAFGDGHRQAKITAVGSDLRPDEPGADDQYPAGPGGQPPLQACRILPGRQHKHPVQGGLRRMRPAPCPHPGGDQQPVEPDHLAVSEADLLAGQVQPGRCYAQPPLRVQPARIRQRRALRRHPPVKDLLRQRRPVIRLMRLVPDQRQRTGEALLAQLRRSPQARKRRADDGDAAGAPESVVAVVRHGGR